jgi:hypothetical protein
MVLDDDAACEHVKVNPLKGSWNLGLQTLGWGSLLVDSDNPLHRAAATNPLLRRGYAAMAPRP